MAKNLVITADDFGAAVEVNQAVERGVTHGVLTAASLMVGAPAAADAVERARRLSGLGVGLHLVLVDGRPVSPPSRVPHLVDAKGNFRADMVSAGLRFAVSAAVRRELDVEIAAQFAAFKATGLALDHVNAHKHFHLHPTIGRLIIEIGAAYGLAAARLPVEPRKVLRAVEPRAAPHSGGLERYWARRARAAFRRRGILVPDQVFGLAWSGAMHEGRLAALIERLPEGLSEIYLHPATADTFAGAAAGYRHREEFAALIAPAVRDAITACGARTGAFADFVVRAA